MNKKIILVFGVLLFLSLFSVDTLILSIQSRALRKSLSSELKVISEKVLGQVTSTLRNDIITGNIRGARAKLEELKRDGFFKDFGIYQDSKLIDYSNSFVNDKNFNDYIVQEILFSANKNEKWGEIKFIPTTRWQSRIENEIGFMNFYNSILLSLISITSFIIIYFLLFKSAQNLIVIAESKLRRAVVDVDTITRMLWFPFLKVVDYASDSLQKAEQERIKSSELATKTLIAKQVAHDIRSPLSALNMVSSTLKEVSEEKRLLIRNAIQRINDIANDLLSKGTEGASKVLRTPVSQSTVSLPVKERNLEIILLPALVDSLVSEKRIQFRDQINVRIEADFRDSYGAFISADSKELSRVLSNMINNSIEAFPEKKGDVTVAVRAYKNTIQLSIKDNGVGIPSDVLVKLGAPGVTYGKEGTHSGSGLGIYHAKNNIEAIGGKFSISSKVGIGTQIDIHLPRATTPLWFPEGLRLASGMSVVCLDDDLTIHGIWKGRLVSLKASSHGIKIFSFTSLNEFNEFVLRDQASHSEANEKRYFLIDYELLGQSATGLDVIKELMTRRLAMKQNIILVTSRYEEPEIKGQCEALGIKLLPKSLAGFVPIEIEKNEEKV